MKDITDSGLTPPSNNHSPTNQSPETVLPPFASYREIPFDVLFSPQALTIIAKISASRLPLLIIGEKGLGQHYLCRYLHERSPLPKDTLLEIDFYSHGKTGADNLLAETFQAIPHEKPFHGTLCLHSLEAIPPVFQSYLLKMLEGQSFTLQDGKRIRFQGRIVACTSSALESSRIRGDFSDCLYFKLTIATLLLRPLRERREIIPQLSHFFFNECRRRLGITTKKLSQSAIECLQNHLWPGNLAELESVIYRSALLSAATSLAKVDLLFGGLPAKGFTEKTYPAQNTSFRHEAMSKKQLEQSENETKISTSLTIEYLAGELSHEIKNPLVAIKTFIQLLPGHINDPEFQSEFFNVAVKSIDRIDYLVDRILGFSKFSRPNFSEVKLIPLILKILQNLKNYPLKIDWEPALPEDVPGVFVDHDQICYCLENILLHIATLGGDCSKAGIAIQIVSGTIRLRITYFGEKKLQGVAVNPKEGKAADLQGLDLFLAYQLLQKNNVDYTMLHSNGQTTITITFPLPDSY